MNTKPLKLNIISTTNEGQSDVEDTFDAFSPVVLAYLGVDSSDEVSVIYGENDDEIYDQTLFGNCVYQSQAYEVRTQTFSVGWVGFGHICGTVKVVATQNASPLGFFVRTVDIMKLPKSGIEQK